MNFGSQIMASSSSSSRFPGKNLTEPSKSPMENGGGGAVLNSLMTYLSNEMTLAMLHCDSREWTIRDNNLHEIDSPQFEMMIDVPDYDYLPAEVAIEVDEGECQQLQATTQNPESSEDFQNLNFAISTQSIFDFGSNSITKLSEPEVTTKLKETTKKENLPKKSLSPKVGQFTQLRKLRNLPGRSTFVEDESLDQESLSCQISVKNSQNTTSSKSLSSQNKSVGKLSKTLKKPDDRRLKQPTRQLRSRKI